MDSVSQMLNFSFEDADDIISLILLLQFMWPQAQIQNMQRIIFRVFRSICISLLFLAYSFVL